MNKPHTAIQEKIRKMVAEAALHPNTIDDIPELEAGIKALINHDDELDRMQGLLQGKIGEVKRITMAIAAMKKSIGTLKIEVANAPKNMAFTGMTASEFTAIKNELAENEALLASLEDELAAQNTSLTLIREEIPHIRRRQRHQMAGIATYVAQSAAEAIAVNIGDEFLKLVNALAVLQPVPTRHFHDEPTPEILQRAGALILKQLLGKDALAPSREAATQYIDKWVYDVAASNGLYETEPAQASTV